MATGASTADLAVVLVDARKGVLPQTRRHSLIASLMGIRHVVLAVNKMDLMGFDQARFEAITAEYAALVAGHGFAPWCRSRSLPGRATTWSRASASMPWHAGPTLLGHLETLELEEPAARPFRMPVQWVNRACRSSAVYAGTVASGALRVGEAVLVAGGERPAAVRASWSRGRMADTAGRGRR